MRYKVSFLRHMRQALEVYVVAGDARQAVEIAYNTVLAYFTLDELAITFTYVRSNELPLKVA